MMNLGNTDGNTIVFFRKSDVISTGDLIDLTRYPLIDLKAGGSIQAFVTSLNKLIDLCVPESHGAGGTLIIPGHGRISDHAEVAYYRDMMAIVRDRIQDMIDKGMTLAQVKAARPTRDYDGRYGSTTGRGRLTCSSRPRIRACVSERHRGHHSVLPGDPE